jgi:hypothetical protein
LGHTSENVTVISPPPLARDGGNENKQDLADNTISEGAIENNIFLFN